MLQRKICIRASSSYPPRETQKTIDKGFGRSGFSGGILSNPSYDPAISPYSCHVESGDHVKRRLRGGIVKFLRKIYMEKIPDPLGFWAATRIGHYEGVAGAACQLWDRFGWNITAAHPYLTGDYRKLCLDKEHYLGPPLERLGSYIHEVSFCTSSTQ
ncbi:hypothetical protein GW17_00049943 [Ensete ventricosum]|nr:hypothetical protein GW17_00049943 [Ensete ventricosum]